MRLFCADDEHKMDDAMLYSVLIFGAEGVAQSLSPEAHEALLQKHRDLQARLEAEGTYRGSVQLMPPSTATHVRDRGQGTELLDGPFAESKEQFLGFYLIECDDIAYAQQAARDLPQGVMTMEVRAAAWAGGPLANNG